MEIKIIYTPELLNKDQYMYWGFNIHTKISTALFSENDLVELTEMEKILYE